MISIPTENSDLMAANEELRQMNHLLKNAMAFTGHEWKNQIHRLQMSVELLLRGLYGPLTAAQTESLRHIQQSALALQDIALNYLTMAQLFDDSFNVSPAYVDLLHDVVEPVHATYIELLRENRQTCEFRVGSGGMLIWAQCGLLKTVYDNLLNNAIKYGKEGGQIVCGALERGRYLELNVWNSGPGMAPDVLDVILNRFVTGTPSNYTKGTGLGLYLVRQIIEAHNGRIWVESQEGAWTNVVFTLPMREWGVKATQSAQTDFKRIPKTSHNRH